MECCSFYHGPCEYFRLPDIVQKDSLVIIIVNIYTCQEIGKCIMFIIITTKLRVDILDFHFIAGK